ncbi:hypothetical protein [Eisenbergiella porci]|uniref:hypothetical protein n=1 Tax=Eisenbergiella porci TaxID=2652274 RepID=UPI002A820D0D|nr:hypothetical protein [Eisenbergiella porci]
MKNRKAAGAAALAVFLSILLTACASSPGTSGKLEIDPEQTAQADSAADSSATGQTEEQTAQPETEQAGSGEAPDTWTGSTGYRPGRNSFFFRSGKYKYTETDYALIQSFHTADYGQMSVEEFNRMVMDWDDEEAYHRTEESFQRIFTTLEEEDALYGFVHGTLSNTWDECDRRHYETCQQEKNPWHSGEAYCETYGDVFGDEVLLTGAYCDISYDYEIPDTSAITVEQRDSLLENIDKEMQTFLEKQDAGKLKDEKNMEKTLDAELGRILEKLEGGLAWGGQKEICYYWDSRYDERDDSEDWEDEGDEEEKYTPQEKYDLVLKALKPDGYEKMSLAEFNRKTHAALSEYDEIMDISYLYEMVLMELEEEQSRITNKTDADVKFLQTTVSNSMDEYYAAERSLYARKQIDPEYAVSINASRKEDVYGDEVVVDLAEGYYSFTYHILDADKLTVAERDKFLEDVVSEVQKRVDNAERGQKLDEAFLKKTVDEAGKAAGNAYIEYTGCTIDYMEQYEWD